MCELGVMMFYLGSAVRFMVKFLGFAVAFPSAVEQALLAETVLPSCHYSAQLFFQELCGATAGSPNWMCVY